MYPKSDVSIIVEILQQVESPTSDGTMRYRYTSSLFIILYSHIYLPPRFHFDSLAHDNSAQFAEIERIFEIPNDGGENTPPAIALKGLQIVSKFNSTVANKVRIMMAVFRVESKATDVVVTFNIPLVSVNGGTVENEGAVESEADFHTFVRSFCIVDLGLFA